MEEEQFQGFERADIGVEGIYWNVTVICVLTKTNQSSERPRD